MTTTTRRTPAADSRTPSSTAPAGTVLRGVLRSQRRSLVLWCVAIAAVAALYTAFYPSIGGVKFETMMESMPPELIEAMGFQTMASASGYVSGTVYALLGAVLSLVFAIGSGARLVAGQEEDGTLELELSAPVSRTRVYLERLAALWVSVLALVATVTVVLLLLSAAMDLGLDPGHLLAASLGLLLFAGALGTLALGIGSFTGRRGLALGVASAVAALSYVLAYVGRLVEGGEWLERVSPYHWYIGAEPLTNGVDWGGVGLLVALAVAGAVVGLTAFRSRDTMV